MFDLLGDPGDATQPAVPARTDAGELRGGPGELGIVDPVPVLATDRGAAHEGNSLLVRFELSPRGPGTLLRMTESGFRDKGWEVAVLEQQFREHSEGWDHFLPRLAAYAPIVRVTT